VPRSMTEDTMYSNGSQQQGPEVYLGPTGSWNGKEWTQDKEGPWKQWQNSGW